MKVSRLIEIINGKDRELFASDTKLTYIIRPYFSGEFESEGVSVGVFAVLVLKKEDGTLKKEMVTAEMIATSEVVRKYFNSTVVQLYDNKPIFDDPINYGSESEYDEH